MQFRHIFVFYYLFLSLFILGCNEKKEKDFFERFQIDGTILSTECHEAEEFPHSIGYQDLKRSLLRAASRDGFSYYAEYYELNSDQGEEYDLLLEEGWKEVSDGLHMREKNRMVRDKSHQEIILLYKKPKHAFYAHVLSRQPVKAKKLFPELFEKKD